jgi:hypothetical protein
MQHYRWVIVLSVYAGSVSHAMDDAQHSEGNNKDKGILPRKRASSLSNPQLDKLAQELDKGQVCVGYVVLGNYLKKLKERIDRNNILFQGPLKVYYQKYAEKYDFLLMDKYDNRTHQLYMYWAEKVRDIAAAPYSTVFVRAYPKRLVGIATCLVTAGLAVVAYFGYEIYKKYMQKQNATTQDSANDTQTTEQPTNPIA